MSERRAALYARAMKWLILASLVALVSCSRHNKDGDTPVDKKTEKPADEKPVSDDQCREDVGDDVKMGAKTGVAGAKTGVTTAGQGIKTFGRSAAGLVEGGSEEAKQRWKEGKEETKATAHEGAADTKTEAKKPKCAGR